MHMETRKIANDRKAGISAIWGWLDSLDVIIYISCSNHCCFFFGFFFVLSPPSFCFWFPDFFSPTPLWIRLQRNYCLLDIRRSLRLHCTKHRNQTEEERKHPHTKEKKKRKKFYHEDSKLSSFSREMAFFFLMTGLRGGGQTRRERGRGEKGGSSSYLAPFSFRSFYKRRWITRSLFFQRSVKRGLFFPTFALLPSSSAFLCV